MVIVSRMLASLIGGMYPKHMVANKASCTWVAASSLGVCPAWCEATASSACCLVASTLPRSSGASIHLPCSFKWAGSRVLGLGTMLLLNCVLMFLSHLSVALAWGFAWAYVGWLMIQCTTRMAACSAWRACVV